MNVTPAKRILDNGTTLTVQYYTVAVQYYTVSSDRPEAFTKGWVS